MQPPDNNFEPDPWIGEEIAGYRILSRIGEGGMGIVYLGRHLTLDRFAAIKFLAAQMIDNKEYVSRFLREARGAAQLNHPHVVSVYEAGAVGDSTYYFIMEYVEGKDLGSILTESGPIPPATAMRYMRQAASALGYAHKKNIIHRDIKPQNLMLTNTNVIKVCDLGLAKWTDLGRSEITRTDVFVGTPHYISPEQLEDAREVDIRADIYSLGATFFHIVTGRFPYEAASPAVIMAMHLNDPVPEPHAANPLLDKDYCEIIKKMMAKRREDRFQTMEELEEVLVQYQSAATHAAYSPSELRSLPRRGSLPGAARKSSALHRESSHWGNRSLQTAALALIMLAVGIFIGLWWGRQEQISQKPVSDAVLGGVSTTATPAPTPAIEIQIPTEVAALPATAPTVVTPAPAPAPPPAPNTATPEISGALPSKKGSFFHLPFSKELLLEDFDMSKSRVKSWGVRSRDKEDADRPGRFGPQPAMGFKGAGFWINLNNLDNRPNETIIYMAMDSVDTSAYDALFMRLRKMNGSKLTVKMILDFTANGLPRHGECSFSPKSIEWMPIVLPFDRFGLMPGDRIQQINLVLDKDITSGGTFVIDDLKLVKQNPAETSKSFPSS